MKTNTYKPNRILVLCIYLIAFVLMTFSFHSRASGKEKVKATKATSVVIDTSMGKITVQLDAEKAPKTVENFLKYVGNKHYDKTIFHRVIKDFMIQGGGFTADMTEKKTEFSPVENESNNGLFNKRGTISMARTSDPNSATAQFFINVKNNPPLDFVPPAKQGYAVFGEVTSGMDVVDKIREVATATKGEYGDVPVKTITINSITRK
jgi:peptidyl-prolyl cis-trans isomerase A (cyclophilin A)